MYEDLALFKVASALVSHAGARQSIIARNIANADTPGYRSRDLKDFASVVRSQPAGVAMSMTRAGHQAGRSPSPSQQMTVARDDGEIAPNGNNVSLETEMVKSTNIKHQHDLAVSVYRNGLDLLRAGLGRGR